MIERRDNLFTKALLGQETLGPLVHNSDFDPHSTIFQPQNPLHAKYTATPLIADFPSVTRSHGVHAPWTINPAWRVPFSAETS